MKKKRKKSLSGETLHFAHLVTRQFRNPHKNETKHIAGDESKMGISLMCHVRLCASERSTRKRAAQFAY